MTFMHHEIKYTKMHINPMQLSQGNSSDLAAHFSLKCEGVPTTEF